MYKLACETCGQLCVNETRRGVESRAERHVDETGHSCEITTVDGAGG